jgi:hypothetical protein
MPELLSFQPAVKILLVSEGDFVVSFSHLKCAPFGCRSNCKVRLHSITTHIPGWFHTLMKKCVSLRAHPAIRASNTEGRHL